MQSNKEAILEQLAVATARYDLRQIQHFQTSVVAESLRISRSLASQYMNELHVEGLLIKVSSRPALFYDRATIERGVGSRMMQQSFLSLEELLAYIERLRAHKYNFEDIVGANGSCKQAIEKIKAAACYPPKGLPLLLVGAHGSGRVALRRGAMLWCISERIIDSESDAVVLDAMSPESIDKLTSLLNSGGASKLIWVTNTQAMNHEAWEGALSYFDSGRPGCTRLFFEYTGMLEDAKEEPAIAKIPIICTVPNLNDRDQTEREAYVYRAFQAEARRIGGQIKISSGVAKRLSGRIYRDNIDGLTRDVRLACANAMASGGYVDAGALQVFSSHIPALDSDSFEGADEYDSDPVFVDVDLYDPFAGSREALSLLEQFITLLVAGADSGAVDEARAKSALSVYLEYIAHHRASSAMVHSADNAVEVVRRVFERNGMNEPVNFTNHLVNCIEFSRSNRLSMSQWASKNRALLSTCMTIVRQGYGQQYEIVSHLSRSLLDLFGWKLDEAGTALLTFYLHWYSGERIASCRGIIVAHGCSTASSIADSVNTMLGGHIFDAVDMPLDVRSEEVVEALRRHLSRTAFASDLLIMVDMGSLEMIGDQLNLSFNTDIGVINNVSTPAALEAGMAMLRHAPLAEVLKEVQEKSRCSYTINKNRVMRDCIIFASENGVSAASRIAELFVKSLPHPIDVEIVTCDYFSLLDSHALPAEIEGKNALFVFGASDPYVEGLRFVSLEDIVGLGEQNDMNFNLDGYLTSLEMEELRHNLVLNFSLENLMRHLTVLEPTHLMDAVSHSIEKLQAGMRVHFSYKMIMRLYIHTSYLVERLVTKDTLDYANAESFEKDHPRFTALARASFKNITRDYGVDLPIGEINYLYDLICIERASSEVE